jgi:transcription elongation factor Elf1
MTDNNPTEFVCPGCGSGYKVVRMKADADLPHRLIHCRVCKHSLTAMDGELVLKYFLIRRDRKKASQGSGA